MKTSKETAETILAQLVLVTDARIRPMMGEYLVYAHDKLIGQINHGQLFIKITPFGEAFAPNLAKESPYDGAKPAFVLPQDTVDNLPWLKEFITGTLKDL